MLQSPIHLRRNISSINLADVINDLSAGVSERHTVSCPSFLLLLYSQISIQSREQNFNIERVQLPKFTSFHCDVSEAKYPDDIDTLYLETVDASCLLRPSPESGMQHYSCQQKVDLQELHLPNSHFPVSVNPIALAQITKPFNIWKPSSVLTSENSMALQNNNWDEDCNEVRN